MSIDLKVSVLVPVYNTERYLQDCIDSLLAQTLPDIEFLFIDDKSTDGSLALLRKNEVRDPQRIRVIESKENLRQGGARNLGLRAARGEYIGFCDSDDLVDPEMFECLYRGIKEQGTQAAVTLCARVPENVTPGTKERDMVLDWDPIWRKRLSALSGHTLSDAERMELLICPAYATVTWLYPKAFLLDNGFFFPESVRFEDNYWAPLVNAHMESVAFVDKVCYYYRRTTGSTTTSRNNRSIYDRKTMENALVAEYQKRGLLSRLYPAIEYMYTTRYAFMTYGFFLYTFDQVPYDELRALMKELREHFPNWQKNAFYRREASKKQKLLDRIRYCFPVLYARLRTFGSKSR